MTGEELEALVDGLLPAIRTLLARELTGPLLRLQALESTPLGRDGRDGQPGRDGAPGLAGADGKDGMDGLGFGDLAVEHDGERTITVKAMRGELVRTLGVVTFPVAIYRGVWLEGHAYEPGDSVTWAGSEWHCFTATTSKPGDGSKAWTLKVKRGRDGKDLR